jgi:hypothetical protein
VFEGVKNIALISFEQNAEWYEEMHHYVAIYQIAALIAVLPHALHCFQENK